MNQCKVTITLLMAGLILGFPFSGSGADNPQNKPNQAGDAGKKITSTSSTVPVYKPPVRGAPGGRVGGGTRGTDQTFVLSVVAPNHTGLTMQEQPELFIVDDDRMRHLAHRDGLNGRIRSRIDDDDVVR